MSLINFLGNIKPFFDHTPKPYGIFHIICFILMVAITIILGIKAKKDTDKQADRVVLIIGIILLVIETYKQIVYTIDAGHYLWYFFPLQFCSMPIYVCMIFPFIKNQKIKDAGYAFLAFYGLIGGLAVMLYPGDVFSTRLITIAMHTMIWHSSMVIVGIYLLIKKQYGKRLLELVPAGAVWFSFVIIAQLVNVIVNYGIAPGEKIVNFFFISPDQVCSLVILNDIQTISGSWLLMFICYIIAFTLAALIVWSFTKLVRVILLATSKQKEKVRLAKVGYVEK